MSSEFENKDVEPFVKMMMIVDRIQQLILSTSSKTQVALVESLTKRQEKSLFVVSRLNATKPEGVTLKELAEHLHMTVPAASVLVESMVRKGLLSRVPSATDRRAVCIKLSQQGQEIFENCCGQVKLITKNLIADVSAADRETFRGVVHHIFEQLFHEDYMENRKLL